MNRHKFNLFPNAAPDDYQRLLDDMRANGGYHSECVFVPRRVIWTEIYRSFGGDGKVIKQ